jgi:uncharacterized protein
MSSFIMLPLVPMSVEPTHAPQPWYHLVEAEPPLVLLVACSQLFSVDTTFFKQLQSRDPQALAELEHMAGTPTPPSHMWETMPEPNALSLNLAQVCNLSCSYCYADEGRFKGSPKLMAVETAIALTRQFLASAPGPRCTIGFIGGEPFLNRPAMQASVHTALDVAARQGFHVGFSVTTNGTLLTLDDHEFLRTHGFSMSVSLDGTTLHNIHRRTKSGSATTTLVAQALKALLYSPGRCKIAARTTVTRDNLHLLERIEALSAEGFQEVGVSPLRTSPQPDLALREEDWPVYLAEMIRAAEHERSRLRQGLPCHFSNLSIALRQIHRGYAEPLPCGAATNYVSASAQGHYFTCHRTIDDPRFALGNLETGLQGQARLQFVTARLVDSQQPCRSCWARYLCGGGCHAEVAAVGRAGCDFIRGWLEYCLRFYPWVLRYAPSALGKEHE